MIFMFLFRLPLGSLFGCVLGSQIDPKPPPEITSKSGSKTVPKKVSKVLPKGSQKGPKIVKNDVLERPLIKKSSQIAPRPPPASILERFWDDFGTMFLWFWVGNQHHSRPQPRQKHRKQEGTIAKIEPTANHTSNKKKGTAAKTLQQQTTAKTTHQKIAAETKTLRNRRTITETES